MRLPLRHSSPGGGFWLLGLLAGLIWLILPARAHAQVERFALIVGNNQGLRTEVELRYAEDDAAKMYDVLRSMGGFRPENMLLLRGENASSVRRALITMNERIRRATGPGRPSTMLYVYYSGHADARNLHLGDSRLELDLLQQLVEGSAASFRILVLDACRSGSLTRVKGGRAAPPITVQLAEQLAGEGSVFLTASSANEDAQESDEIKGSFFTHYLVSGMVGAADDNGDGRIVLEEAYRYAYEHTLRASSRTLAGTQHPTFRYDLRGQGQIVLTRVTPTRKRAIVELPQGRSYLLFSNNEDGPVVAEVGANDAVRRISVKAGRYFVRGRAPSYLLEGTVSLEGGSQIQVRDELLSRIDYARFVRKGLSDTRALHGPQVGMRARSALFNISACMGPYVGYALESRRITIVPRLAYCSADAAVTAYSEASAEGARGQEFSADVRVSHEWDLPWVTVGIGLMPGAALVADSALVEGGVGGYRLVGTLGSTVGATAELPGSAYAGAELGLVTYVQRKRTFVFAADATSIDEPRAIENELDAAVVMRLGLVMGMRW